MRRAAETLTTLGLTADEIGEFFTSIVAESDWADYTNEDDPVPSVEGGSGGR